MADIHYRFIGTGAPAIRSDFRSIGEEAKTSSRQVDEGMRRMRTAVKETAREDARSGADRQRAVKGTLSEQEKSTKYVAAIKDRHFRDEQRKQEQLERAEQRSAARADAQRQRDGARMLGHRRREIAGEVADRQKHASRIEDIARKGAEKNADRERRHQQRLVDLRQQSTARLAKIAEQAEERTKARASSRAFDNELTSKRRLYEIDKRRKELGEKSSLTAGLGGQIKGAVIGGALATAAVATGITGAAARDALRLQEVSNRLSIAARGAGEEAVDPTALRREFQQTAIKTPGVKSADIAEAVAQFVSKTGNLDVARKSQGVFATVASATGSQVQDVAAAAADLFQKFDINTVEGMADAMAALAFQGKAGAFELKDAAGQFAKLSAAASRFGLDKGAGGVRVLGGLTQIARTATGSSEQAATAVEAMFRQFTATSGVKALRGIGVNPFKDRAQTQTKDIRELIVETITKSGGNLTKLQSVFGEEGIRAISPIITAFNEAERAKKGTGKAAATEYIRGAIEAPGNYAELQRDAAQAQQDASAKLTMTWESLTSKIGESTIPLFTKLAETLENSPGVIDAFVGTIENVISFFVALIAATQDVLEVFGLATKKTKSPEQIRDEERKKASTYQKQIELLDKKRGGSWDEESRLRKGGKIKEADAMAKKLFATSSMDEERATLVGKLEVSKRRVGEANAEVEKVQDQQKNIRSAAAFADEYAKMLGPEESAGENKSRAELVAKVLRDSALGNKSVYTGQGKLEGETDEAQQFRLNQLQARRERLQNAGVKEQGQTGAATVDSGMGAAAAKMLEAANKMVQAAGKPNQASIVPAP